MKGPRLFSGTGPTLVKLSTLLGAIALVCIVSTEPEAADWVELTRNAPGTVIYYLDLESIHFEGDRATFWDRRVLSDDPDYREMRGYNEVDCSGKKYRTLRITGYDKNGKSSSEEDAGEWRQIAPDTAMSVLYRYVCKE
ncbi:MAG: hypothetical protein M1497_01970 [Nitrospirae bacterium]|nr:hypothetical protein [Nitrospirota bacterium]